MKRPFPWRPLGLTGIAVVILFLFGFWWARNEHQENRFDALILAAARQYEVDPALVKAVVWQESRFNASARGAAGEVGLMQIREAAAGEWAAAERIERFGFEQLTDPGTNTLAGTWYLAHVLKRYQATDNPVPYALADYNAGRRHVLRWNKGTASTNADEFVRGVTFPGTRRYIEAVIKRRERYQDAIGLTPGKRIPPAARDEPTIPHD